MAILKVKNLTKDFGHGRGIFDVNFEIKQGEVFGFLGPNGAGKTTTIRHLMGFTKPDGGGTEILGYDCSRDYAKAMKQVGYLPGEIALPEGLTGWQFIRMIQKMRKIQSDEFLNYLLDLFKFDPSGPTKRMSLGNKRKLAIVTAFMGDPDILILDEPTSGLDPVMQEYFIQFMIKEKQRRKTILLSSHIFPEVEATCDRIAIIKEGKIVSEVDVNSLKNQESKSYSLYFDTLDKLNKAKSSLQGAEVFKDDLHVEVSVAKDRLNQFMATVRYLQPKCIKELKFDLENYFLDFYRTDRIFEEL